MKRILVFILCLMLVCVTPLVAFAEDYEVGDVFEGEVPEDNSTPETETPTEGENSPPAETPEEEPDWNDVKDTVSNAIVNWILPHIEEISVVVTLVLSTFYQMRKHKLLNQSVGTLNNNAITVAKESSNFMSQALTNIENASGAVTSYDARIVALLDAYQQTAEDKLKLEREIVEMKSFLKTATDANVEFANELAELLALANIPNYKKEALGSRHLTAVNAIIEAEAKAEAKTEIEEVKKDDGEEA